MPNHVGPFGNTSGTSEGPGTGAQGTTVTKITAYASNSYIFGLKLYWGSTNVMFGSTGGVSGVDFDLTGDPVTEIKYFIDGVGNLRALKFNTDEPRTFEVGLQNVADLIAFSDSADRFTDMITYKGTVNGTTVIWGIEFYYTGPAYRLSRPPMPICDAAWTSLSIMAHAAVVVKSFMKVGKLRNTLNIKAPSCEPPPSTSPADVQLWHRTFRAQENCKEMFLIYLPSIMIASSMGYQAFGKWAPRAVGTFAFAGAFFRYKYLNAYIADADSRGKPFYYALLFMRPIMYLAVISSGYLIGRELYYCIKNGCCSSCKSKPEEEDA